MAEKGVLGSIFVAALPVDARIDAEVDALEGELEAFVAQGRAAWPTLAVEVETFVRFLAARAGGALPPRARAADLWLACACAEQLPGAVEAFGVAFDNVIGRVLARRAAAGALADDARQVVLARLFVGPSGGSGKIAEYRGSGALRSWVAATVATTLLMMRRTSARRRETGDEDSESGVAGAVIASTPDLAYMKARYGAEMATAVVVSLGRLDDRARALLKLHLGERMSIDRLGVLYGVNRATAARWLSAARSAVLAGTRADLRARLSLSDSECDSIVALVQNELDVSILRHLG